MIQIRILRLVSLILLAAPAFAAELELRYSVLERILAQQLFTVDGRHHVRGSKSTRCQFAFLEAPHIDSEQFDKDQFRLRVKARFSGRSAIDVFGGCVGVGDSFDLTLTATPFPRNGAIALRNISVTTVKDSYYIRRVRAAMAQSISKDFKIEVRDQARKLLEQSGAAYQQELASFDLGEIRVTPEALVLVVDFRLVVK
jgi:hypothetical protein